MSDVRGIQHELSYEAIASGQIDLTDIYTTDPQIEQLSLVLLDDDLSFFPRYDAVLLYRLDLDARSPGAFAAMAQLVGKIDGKKMTHANGSVALHKTSSEAAAHDLLEGSPRHRALAERKRRQRSRSDRAQCHPSSRARRSLLALCDRAGHSAGDCRDAIARGRILDLDRSRAHADDPFAGAARLFDSSLRNRRGARDDRALPL